MLLKREIKKHINYSSRNPLPLQQQAIKRTMIDYLGVSAFLFIALIVMLLVDLWEDKSLDQPIYILIILSILVGMFIYYLTHGVLCFNIWRKLIKICYTSEQVVSINCHSVSFILKSISKFSSVIACIILTDEMGDKFYYVYLEDKEPSDLARKNIKEQYLGNKIELICYKNTNIIKRF